MSPHYSLQVRAAVVADAGAINRIYNHYIRDSAITFDVEPWSEPQRTAWLGEFSGDANPYHALVAESAGEIVGFAFNSQFRAKACYRLSTETTIYIAPQNQSCGVGSALYTNLFCLLAKTELHRAFAAITLPNCKSIKFHQSFGFTQIGILSQVGYKFNRYVDVAWFEKKLK